VEHACVVYHAIDIEGREVFKSSSVIQHVRSLTTTTVLELVQCIQ